MRPTNIPTEGLVASYLFNGNTRDGTANHFDCTARNGAHLATNRAGRANAAYAFDGVDDYIECPTSPRLGVHVGVDMTASAWIGPYTPNTEGGILSKYRHFLPQICDFYISINDQIMYVTGQGFNVLDADAPIQGAWTHVAVVFRGTSGDATLYLNGNAIRTAPLTYNPVPGTEPLRIGTTVGADPDGFGSFYGTIDDVRIYERALSASEVRSLYTEIPR
jgi:hypothetical protein